MKRLSVLALLCSVVVVSGAPRAVATFPGANGLIAFESFGRPPSHLGVVQPDGSGFSFLSSSDHRSDYEPAWTADGSTIVFDSQRGGDPPQIWTIAADGSGHRLVFAGAPRFRILFRPVWSPDAHQIAFCAYVTRGFIGHIFTMNADGSSLTNISGTQNLEDCDPDWSPDGSKIAFTDGGSVATMNPDGTGRATLVTPGYWPTWSPDGSMIAFTRYLHHPRQTDLFVVGSDGTNLTRLTDTPKRWEGEPAFSPDGTLVAFSRSIGPDAPYPADLWTVALAGLSTTRVTDTKRDEQAASWQPI